MSDHLRNKLHNYEVIPPGRVWDSITAILDNEEKAEFPGKLYALEVAPPSSAWNKIIQVLDHDAHLTVPLSEKRNVFPMSRYAVAASLLGIAVIVCLWLVNRNNAGNTLVKKEFPGNNNLDSNSSQQAGLEGGGSKSPKIITGKSFLGDDKKWLVKSDLKPLSINRSAVFNGLNNSPVVLFSNFSPGNFEEKYQEPKSSLGTISYDPSKISDDNPYILFLNPDGYVVRLSKKIVSLIGCVYNTTDDNNPGCKDQLKKWREKIAQSSITPSPGNFLDIVELVKTIRDNYP